MTTNQAQSAVAALVEEMVAIRLTPTINIEDDLDNEELLHHTILFTGWPSVEGYGEIKPFAVLNPQNYEEDRETFKALYERTPLSLISFAPNEWLDDKSEVKRRTLKSLNEQFVQHEPQFRVQLADGTEETIKHLLYFATANAVIRADRKAESPEEFLQEVLACWNPSLEAVQVNKVALVLSFVDGGLVNCLPNAAFERVATAALTAEKEPDITPTTA